MPNWKKLITSGSEASLGNLFVQNAVTASYFKGDGSGLTNVQTEIIETATVSDTFTSVTQKVVIHDFDTKDVIVTVYNDSDEQIIPASIITTTVNSVTINFDSSTSGRIVVAKGGHIVQGLGTAADSNTLNGQSGSYYLDYANHTGAVTASTVTANSFIGSLEGTASYATTFDGLSSYQFLRNDQEGTLVGNLTISGSLTTSGSQVRFLSYPWPEIGQEVHLLKTDGYEIIFNEATRSYDYHGIALEYIDDALDYYHNSLILYTYNQAQGFGGEINIGPLRTHMRQSVSGSDSVANVSVRELPDGRSQALLYGDVVQLGVFRGANINLGNTASLVSISGSSVDIGTDITASGHIVPSINETYDLGTDSLRWRDLYLSGSTIHLGGTRISTDTNGDVSITDSTTGDKKTLTVNELKISSGSSNFTFKVDTSTNSIALVNSDSGVAASSNFYKLTVSGSAAYNITHSLAEDFPIVQVYDTSKNQVLPASITSSDENVVQIVFDSNFNGTVVVKK